MTKPDWFQVPCPAKLNLMLHITGRLPNGYHQLQTLFQLLDICDQLRIRLRNDNQICLKTPIPGVPDEQNLVVKAARLLQQHCACQQGCDIELDKHLPMGGGLGGGSSNAASTLVSLNQLWHCDLSIDELADLGLQLGADVPVFVRGHSAWAEGVGEQLTPVELPESWFVVIHPGVQISTATVFNHPNLTRNTPVTTIRTALNDGGHNDCEPVARALYSEVDAALNWLNKFAPARLTGTGACIFARFDRQEDAKQVVEQLPTEWQGFLARGVNHSPLYPNHPSTQAI